MRLGTSPLFLVLTLGAWFWTSSSVFAIPQLISYQGILKDDSGNFLTGTYSIQFKIYDTSTEGSALWTETQPNVSVSSGKFSVQLGSVTPLELDFDEDYWLSIKVEDDAEMTPRVQITSAGYAYRAQVAEDVINGFTQEQHDALSHKNTEAFKTSMVVNAKTNFKLDAYAEASANSLGEMIVDSFMDDSGIAAIPSDNYLWRDAPDFDVVVSPSGIDSDVVLAVHANGTDASTNFNDSSPSTKSITVNGDAQIDTAQYKFGNSCVLFDGSGDYLSVGNSMDFDFGNGNFTIDFWIRLASSAHDQAILSNGTSGGNTGWNIYLDHDGRIDFAINGAQLLTYNPSLTTGQWYHIAIVRDSTTSWRMFVNGVQVDASSSPAAISASANALTIGKGYSWSGSVWINVDTFSGWMDELRISKGIARWTSGFTPSAAEYSAMGGTATVISTASTVNASPAAVMVISDELPNTGSLSYFISRNNGTNWTECPKETLCDISSQPSGTQMKWKVEIEDDAELNAIAVAI